MDLMNIKLCDGDICLRPITIDDKEDIYREFTDEITRYMTPMPAATIDGVVGFINGSLEKMKQGSNIQLVLKDSTTHEFLGCVGLHHVDCSTPEFGIWLKKGAHGHS